MKLSEAYRRYVTEYLEIKGTDLNQITHYNASAKLWCDIVGDVELDEITMRDVADFTSGLKTYGRKRSVNTVAYYIKELRVVLRYWRLRGEKVIDSEIIPIPKRMPNIPSFLQRDEVEQMIRASRSIRTKFVISFLYSTGLRVSEFHSLNRDVCRSDEFTVIGKGRKMRICFIDKRARRYMEKYLSSREDDSEALLVTAQGQRCSVSTIQLIVRNAAKRAGIGKRVTPHTLRHSFATNYLTNDGNIRDLADMMGHNSIQTTQGYTHVTNNNLRRSWQRCHTY